MHDVTASLGHNLPAETLDPDMLHARLERDYASTLDRFTELELGVAKIPNVIPDEGEAGRITDWFGNQCRRHMADVKKIHDREKAPFLACSKVVDRFFLDRIKRLDKMIEPVEHRIGDFLRAKRIEARRREEELRQQAAQEALRAAREAQRHAEEARTREAEGKRREAVAARRMAEEEARRATHAQAVVEAPPAPVTIRGDFGSTAFSVEGWDYVVLDPLAVPRDVLTIDDQAVRMKIAAGARSDDIPGITIYQVEQTRIKRC